MDYSRLPRRMLSCWVAHQRPRGAPRMIHGRSARKALDTFDLDHNKWPELAADRLAWRAMLRSREPPPDYRAPPPTPAAPSRSHGPSELRLLRLGERLPALAWGTLGKGWARKSALRIGGGKGQRWGKGWGKG